jgi:hypothetical protein
MGKWDYVQHVHRRMEDSPPELFLATCFVWRFIAGKVCRKLLVIVGYMWGGCRFVIEHHPESSIKTPGSDAH